MSEISVVPPASVLFLPSSTTVKCCSDNADQANVHDSIVHPLKTEKLLLPFLELRAFASRGAAVLILLEMRPCHC